MLRKFYHKDLIEAGCDEAGRGCLAGPVFAAAVILPQGFRNPGINDSKQLNEDDRYRLRDIIMNKAVAWAVASCDNLEIDEVNILNASFLAMHRSVEQLKVTPEHLLIDGNRFNPYPGIDHTCIVEGDAKYLNIAAASILAKTFRDDFMKSLHHEFPHYDWENNKGYPTIKHRRAIMAQGITPYHRRSYNLTFEEVVETNLVQ